MTNIALINGLDRNRVAHFVETAGRMIPPAWPLSATVAVNPFLGQKQDTLAGTGGRLARIGGLRVTMPREWYRERIGKGEIADEDLEAALAFCPHVTKPESIEILKAEALKDAAQPEPLPTVAALVMDATGYDWPGILQDRIGAWAAAYFDEGQALWSMAKGRNAWDCWRAFATHDLTPEIHGLTGFGAFVAGAPQKALDAIERATMKLGLTEAALASYYHQLLHDLGGWGQMGRYRLWQAELNGGTDTTLTGLLAIRLIWEEALFIRYEKDIATRWKQTAPSHEAAPEPDFATVVDTILQEAFERAGQRMLGRKLAARVSSPAEGKRPALQAAFCIDVRSEVIRRALESLSPDIRTMGFAGFFGIAANHRRFASDVEEKRLPVLLNPAVRTCSVGVECEAEDRKARYSARAVRAWGRFKLAAVSSFAFVESMGPVYAAKLVRDALGIGHANGRDDPPPRMETEVGKEQRVEMAETILRAMSLTEGFAPVVLLVGHGANVVNNPHASALHCGACGGYSGEVNARLLIGLLNDFDVREGLKDLGIDIPDDTVFIAARHDTTTDAVTLFDRDPSVLGRGVDVEPVRKWLDRASALARAERALRLPNAGKGSSVAARSRDWSETRPEWGLSGCSSFIAAPRTRTAGMDLEGRAFLHDYDWRADSANGYKVLELIMTAPVVVASWISLQYYGSAVAPDHFGAGNKLLHNVVGGMGVLEGNGGLLRTGLPIQSIHDGTRFIHEPMRLSVCIEAPCEAMTEILRRHDDVRALFDNRWLHLLAMDGEGKLSMRYNGNLTWSPLDAKRSSDAEEAKRVKAC